MIFGIFKGLFAVLVFILIILLILFVLKGRTRITRKQLVVLIVLAIAVQITYLVGIFSVDVGIASFSSPEEVFIYNNMSEPILIIQGEYTDLAVVGIDGTQFDILKKTNTGWKRGSYFETNPVFSGTFEGYTIQVFRDGDSESHYIVLTVGGECREIQDNCSSKFYKYNVNYPNSDIKRTICYAYVDRLDDTYIFTIDGKTLGLKDFIAF